jgi:polyhydroxybutyrate depolymerase
VAIFSSAPIVLAALLLAAACAAEPAPGDQTRALTHGGRARSYVLHVPPGGDGAPRPLLLAFHGGGGDAHGFQRNAGLDRLADRDGWLVAYPNGTGRFFDARLLTWNAGGCCAHAQESGVDDVGFALAVIDDAARAAPVDRARVYATGHSNGAMMAYRLAAEAADRIAAIAPVGGAMTVARFAPSRPVPVLHVHSVDDPRALYAGGVTRNLGREIRHNSVEAELARWRERDGCPAQPEERERRERRAAGGALHRAVLLVWAPCAAGSEVRLWRLAGGGHGWPGADPILSERLMGPRTDVISASEEVWAFLARFALPPAPRAAPRRQKQASSTASAS